MGSGTLFRLTQSGSVYTMTTGLGYIDGLDFASKGHLFMTSDSKLYQVETTADNLTYMVYSANHSKACFQSRR